MSSIFSVSRDICSFLVHLFVLLWRVSCGFFGHVACSGFARSTGPATIYPRSSSSPELQLLSSLRRTDLARGDFGGDSSCLSCLMFSGGALLFGAGGGGASLVLFSALVSAIAISSSLRCACGRASCPSCLLSRSPAFFSCSLMSLRSLVSSSPGFPSSLRSSSTRMSSFFDASFSSDSRLLFFLEFFLEMCAKFLVLFLFLRVLLFFSRFFPPVLFFLTVLELVFL